MSRMALHTINNMTYIDFSTSNQFMDEFTSAFFLPHTNLNDFPSAVPRKNHKSPKNQPGEEFGTSAVFMAKVVAQNILGRNKVFPGIINANATTVYDWSIGSSGLDCRCP